MVTFSRNENSPASQRNIGLFMLLIVIGQVMISLDFTAASIALPSIGRGLSIGPSLLQWVISGMSLAFGGFMIVGGRLSDLFGQKNCYIAGIALMTLGTLGASLANSVELLIPVRAMFGIGAALALPATLSLIATSFPTDHERVKVISIITMAQCLTTPLGTLAAGSLMGQVGWHGAFLLNGALGIGAFACAPTILPVHVRNPAIKRTIDLPGSLLVIGGSALLVWSLSGFAAQGLDAPAATLWALGGSAVILALFVVQQRISDAPLIPVTVLRSSNLPGGVGAAGLTAIGVAGMFTLVTMSAQQSLRFSPIGVGFLLFPYGITSMATSLVMPRFSKRLVARPRASIFVGFAILGMANLIMSLAPDSGSTLFYFFAATIVAPIGLIIAMSIAVGEAMSGVSAAQQGIAAAMIYMAQQIFLAVGISVMVSSVHTTPDIVTGRVPMSAFAVSFLIGLGICVAGGVTSLLALNARPARLPIGAAE